MDRSFICLASASPRRAALLRQLGIDFRVVPANLAEHPGHLESPAEYVVRMAEEKTAAVYRRTAEETGQLAVLGADTVVVIDGEILGKPADRERAVAMLERLSGRQHEVLTAVVVRDSDQQDVRLSASKVRFRATTRAELEAYCATNEPFDKAGSYAVQGFGAVFIQSLEGSYTGVMGLPLFETAELLQRFSLPAWLCGARLGS